MGKMRGTLLLLGAALIWGLAFVAQTSAATSVAPFTFNAARSLLAAAFLFVSIRLKNSWQKPASATAPASSRRLLVQGGLWCGTLTFLAVNLQQFGIASYPPEAAASGRAGFLTATYVIMVALYAKLKGQKLHPAVLSAALLCLVGMYLLCLSGGFSGLYLGDLLELACALLFTVYILQINNYSHLDGLSLSCLQFLVCGLLSLLGMLLWETPNWQALSAAWLPICYVGIFSSGVGYTLQIVGQKYAEPAVASIVMSLESVFAALSGWLILGERLSSSELTGCALVFLAVLLAQLPALLASRSA